THLFLKHTRDGRALCALAQVMNAARMMGVRVPFMVMICFLIGSALAGVAGVLIGYKYDHLTALSGFLPGLKGFVAAVIGGMFSLGHPAFMALGGYAAAILTYPVAMKSFRIPGYPDWLLQLQMPFLPALLIGGAVASLAAILVGWPVLRLRGHYLAVATLG